MHLPDKSPAEQAKFPSRAQRDLSVAASLRIAFIHNKPDLRIEIPAIPG